MHSDLIYTYILAAGIQTEARGYSILARQQPTYLQHTSSSAARPRSRSISETKTSRRADASTTETSSKTVVSSSKAVVKQ